MSTSEVRRRDPFTAIETLFHNLSEGFVDPFRGTRMPATDIWTENDDKLVVEAQLPAFEPSEVSVDVDGGVLAIHAEHSEKQPADAAEKDATATQDVKKYVPLAAPPAPRRVAITKSTT